MLIYSNSEPVSCLTRILGVAFGACNNIDDFCCVAADVFWDGVGVFSPCACDFVACNEMVIELAALVPAWVCPCCGLSWGPCVKQKVAQVGGASVRNQWGVWDQFRHCV